MGGGGSISHGEENKPATPKQSCRDSKQRICVPVGIYTHMRGSGFEFGATRRLY
jgi:hypothetical protein